MIQKITFFITKCLIFFGAFFAFEPHVYAQEAIAPQTLSGLDKICAGNNFNEYFATFSYVNFPAGTTFVIELLDGASTPIATTLTEVIQLGVGQQTIKFAVPNNLIGANDYGLRVKSSTGYTSTRFKTPAGDSFFPAFFKDYEASFYINDRSDSATICVGGTLTLSVSDLTPEIPGSSPVHFPNVKYKWYKDDVVIAGQSAKTLVVSTTGKYHAEMDYGQCSDVNYGSNRVNVTSSSTGSPVTIDSSLGNPFCSNGSGTVLTATAGNSYVWKKDGVVITGATSRSYATNESGLYSVDVDFGGCSSTGTINLVGNGFNASIDVADSTKIEEGETLSVTVTTDATSPTFEWYKNGNIIPGATADTYVVTTVGNYKVKVSQTSGCVASMEFEFKVTGPAIPTLVIQNIVKLSGQNPYWNIPDAYKNADTTVIIISSNGDKVLDVTNYQGDWPQTAIDFKNINPVYYYVIQGDAGEKKGSITVIK